MCRWYKLPRGHCGLYESNMHANWAWPNSSGSIRLVLTSSQSLIQKALRENRLQNRKSSVAQELIWINLFIVYRISPTNLILLAFSHNMCDCVLSWQLFNKYLTNLALTSVSKVTLTTDQLHLLKKISENNYNLVSS